MPEKFDITVENKLITDKRDINVYHHASGSAHIISFYSSITIPFGTIEEDDYLHISVVSGPGNLWKDYLIALPSWINFEFSTEGKITLSHSGARTLLNVPPGPPTWQLKMTRQTGIIHKQTPVHVTIGDYDREANLKIQDTNKNIGRI